MSKRDDNAQRFRVLRILILCAGLVLAARIIQPGF